MQILESPLKCTTFKFSFNVPHVVLILETKQDENTTRIAQKDEQWENRVFTCSICKLLEISGLALAISLAFVF